jgi:hypothetical protein
LKRRWDYFTSWEESHSCPQYASLLTWCLENNLDEEAMSKLFGAIEEQHDKLASWLYSQIPKSMPSSKR